MKTHTTRTRPNYGILVTLITSILFWTVIIKIFLADQIKEWIHAASSWFM